MEKEAQFSGFPFLAEVFEENKPKKEDEESEKKAPVLFVSDEDENKEVVEDKEDDDDKTEDESDDDEIYEEETAAAVPEKGFVFKLDFLPGAEKGTVEILEEEPEKEEIDEKTNTPKSAWDWQALGVSNFLGWVHDRFKKIPSYKGSQLSGVERATAYLKRLNSEISKAMSQDYDGEIDVNQLHDARKEIIEGLKRLNEHLKILNEKNQPKSKKAFVESYALTKNAETSTTGRIIVSVPYFISNIARACIESTVQSGHDIEKILNSLDDEYKFDKREKFQVVQLIKDMGYPILLDRINAFKDIKPSEVKESEYMTQYYA